MAAVVGRGRAAALEPEPEPEVVPWEWKQRDPLRSALTDSGYSLGLPQTASHEAAAGGALSSPRSPRLSMVFSGRPGLLVNELLNAQNPDIEPPGAHHAKILRQQREARLLFRAHGRIGEAIDGAEPTVEEIEAAIAKLRAEQLRFKKALSDLRWREEQADAEEKQRVHQEGVLTPRTLALVQAEEERKKKREIGTSPHSTHATRTQNSPSRYARYACCTYFAERGARVWLAARLIRPLLKALGIPLKAVTEDKISFRRRTAQVFGGVNSDNSGGFTAEQLQHSLDKGGKYLEMDEIRKVMNAFETGLHCSAAQVAKKMASKTKRGLGLSKDKLTHSAVAAERNDGTINFEEFAYAIEAACEDPEKRTKKDAMKTMIGKRMMREAAESFAAT